MFTFFIIESNLSLQCPGYRIASALNTDFSKLVSDILHRLAVRICPAALNSLSTAALLGKAALYLQKDAETRGKAAKAVVSSDAVAVYSSTSATASVVAAESSNCSAMKP